MKLDWQNWFQEKRFAAQWERAKDAAQLTPMAGYYSAPVATDQLLNDAPLIALDFESDGLEEGAQLLEAGWVAVEKGAVKLSSARRLRIRAESRLQGSAVVIHRITDDAAAEGQSEQDVLLALLADLKGAAIIAHAAIIEQSFLNAACLRCFGVPFVGRFICTMNRRFSNRVSPKDTASNIQGSLICV